jgi:hypothetical protein
LSFHVLWKAVSPLITLLHVERATILGHLLYGTLLGRYPAYLPRPPAPAVAVEQPAAGQVGAEEPADTPTQPADADLSTEVSHEGRSEN